MAGRLRSRAAGGQDGDEAVAGEQWGRQWQGVPESVQSAVAVASGCPGSGGCWILCGHVVTAPGTATGRGPARCTPGRWVAGLGFES